MSVSSSSRSSENKPAFTGHIANTLDALLVFEACRRGSLPRIQSRLSEPERRNIKSGDVYVFGEEESRIKRWTDGRRWSPSRIMNNFLIYKELEPSEKELKKSTSFIPANPDTDILDDAGDVHPSSSSTIKRERSQSRFGDDMFDGPPSFPSTPAAKEKVSQIPLPGIVLQGGLIKKTISVGGLHMISYYNPADLKTGILKTPSSVDELASLDVNHIFLLARYFRHPPQVAFGEDGMPRFVALTDEDPMPRKNSTSTTTSARKVKQESSSRQDEARRDSGAGSSADNAGPSFFPKVEPQDDVFPEDFGSLDPSLLHNAPLPNRRSSAGYSGGNKYRTVPGLARSLSSASDSTATAARASEVQELPPSMRPRTGSSSGGHRHEPYRLPMSRGSSTTSPSSYHPHPHPHPSVTLKSPRHSFSMEYSPNMTHLRHNQRTDVMYTEGIGRHLRSASLNSGLGVPSSRGSMTSSPSMHTQVGIANENAIAATSSPHSTLYEHQSPYFDSQHSYTAYSSPYMAQRPYTSPDGSVPEQAMQGNYIPSAPTEQMYAFPTAEVLEQQVNKAEEHARRVCSPNMPAQLGWSGYQGGEICYVQHPMQHQEQYGQPSQHYMDQQQANTSFGVPAALPHPPEQQADSIFMSGHQPYPMGEFIQHHYPAEHLANEGDSNMARNAIFQYYPPSSSSMSQQHSIPLLRTEFSPLMPASASYPSSLSSLHPQLPQQVEQEAYQQAPQDQQQAGLGLQHLAPPSYSHPQQSYPANLGKAKIDYKVVEPVSWPAYTSPKVAQYQHQHLQQQPGVYPSQLHPEHPDVG